MALLHSPKIPTDGLVLCLDPANTKSYSSSGSYMYDLSKNNNHAQLINSPIYSKENGGIFKLGQGVNSYLEIPDSDSLDLTSGITIGIWVRFSQQNTDFSFKNVFGKPTYFNYGIILEWYNGDNGVLVDFSSNVGRNSLYYATTSADRNVNRWIFVMLTYQNNNQENNNNLYYFDKNGLNYNWESNIQNTISTTAIGDIVINEEPIFIGDNFNDFPMDIGPAYLYNRGLSKKEVLDIFNSTRGRFGI